MRKNQDTRRGSAVMEFALLMALLLTPLLAGIWDAAQMIDMNQVLTRAAREGVIMASRGDDPTETVRSYVAAEGLSTDNLTVSVEFGPEDRVLGQEVSVSLNYNFADNTVYPWGNLMPDGMTTVARAKME
ncbi:TadE family protein [Pseudodesulfovibrio mercurii]|uniref:TadE family protein n=1 Tax=Pseudodesulfovibrio mercurii TaxID=641491 RepID=F0JJZ0_9BACT|nr:TadE/TadG family type IV pilus assembly protein [Pseudodesulfovibrio mercurii]EGB16239.1 TadE family protein [Pseudodesulfovibrio mercurii]